MPAPATQRIKYADGLGDMLARLREKTGHSIDTSTAIPDDMTFRQWCIFQGEEGMRVDGKRFKLDDRPAMAWIYDQVPTTPLEAKSKTLVIMKCTQVGFTVLEMLAVIYMALKFGAVAIGMFVPSMALAGIKSSNRFMPIVRLVPAAYKALKTDPSGANKHGEGNVLVRNMGPSRFYFLWTTGKAMTESNPMDILTYDEVQEMSIEQMEKTSERLSASDIKYRLMGSTANFPDADIHFWFKQGTQHQFHTHCDHCHEDTVLVDHFPKCIQSNNGSVPGAPVDPELDYVYACPHCGHYLPDTQNGEWRAKYPERKIQSIHFPQFLSPTISASEIMHKYLNSVSKQNFYNRTLGMPFVDPSQMPVTLAHCNAAAEEGMRIGLQWLRGATDTYMGIDQMGSDNRVIIKQRLKDGRQAVVHVEIVYSDDPFARCSELIEQYGVKVCVVEQLPNVNDARRFANRHKGIVFLADYANTDGEMMQWSDGSGLNASQRKTDEESRARYRVKLDQYKCMQASMARITEKNCLFPDPQGLIQEVKEKDGMHMRPVLQDVVFYHFTRTALVVEMDDEQRKYKKKVVKVGIDPHFSYTNMLCDIAWARAYGTSTFFLPEDPGAEKNEEIRQNIQQGLPGLPSQVRGMMESTLPETGVCGRCFEFDAENEECKVRSLHVKARDASCVFFVSKD